MVWSSASAEVLCAVLLDSAPKQTGAFSQLFSEKKRPNTEVRGKEKTDVAAEPSWKKP